MVERAQLLKAPEAPQTGVNAYESTPTNVRDRSTNNFWQLMTENRSFSNPGALQMLNNGLAISDSPVLLADNNKERGSEVHDWLRQKIKDAKDSAKDKPLVHEVSNDAQEVMKDLKAILHDPNRDKGEFSWAIGAKDGKLYGSSASFTPSEGKSIDGSETHASADLGKMEVAGYKISSVIHTHPNEQNMDISNFSDQDIAQADILNAMYGNVRSYLLTPDNHWLVYSKSESKEHPKGEEIGFFLKNDYFVCTNEKYKAFKSVY